MINICTKNLCNTDPVEFNKTKETIKGWLNFCGTRPDRMKPQIEKKLQSWLLYSLFKAMVELKLRNEF